MEEYLYSLPTELLLEIFKRVELKDLLNLRLTCHRFNTVIANSVLHLFVKSDMLVTNQLAPEMAARSLLQLNIIEKLRISKNWMCRQYRTYNLNVENMPAQPCLSLERDFVWVSSKNSVNCFKRKVGRQDKYVRSLTADSGEREIYKFVSKQNCIISGLGDGSLWIWYPKLEERVLLYERCHSMAITAVDLQGAVFATGSKDGYCSLWLLDLENPTTRLVDVHRHLMRDNVLCTKFSPSGQQLLVGTGGGNCSALSILDLERLSLSCCFRDNKLSRLEASEDCSGILDIKFESPNIFLMCENDGLRTWDLRINQCTRYWKGCAASVVCFDYDNYCTVITGDKYGIIKVWDTRKNTSVLPMLDSVLYDTCWYYFFYFDKMPVYSLAFDATHLYRASRRGYVAFDFTL